MNGNRYLRLAKRHEDAALRHIEKPGLPTILPSSIGMDMHRPGAARHQEAR